MKIDAAIVLSNVLALMRVFALRIKSGTNLLRRSRIWWPSSTATNYSGYNSDIRGKRQESYRLALDAVVSLDKEQQKKFADTVVQLQKVYALVVTSKRAQAISSEVAFFGAVKSALMKILQAVSPHDNPVTNRELNLRLDQLVNQSVIAKQPIDLYKELGLERP